MAISDAENPLLAAPAALNPYSHGIYEICNRLLWDLTFEAVRSRRILRSWRDRFAGGKAVILCNGPSLLQTQFDRLGDVFTFGLNKINLLFEKNAFRPSCIVAINPFVIEQNQIFYNSTQLPLFLDSVAVNHVAKRPSVAFLRKSSVRMFARDCSISVDPGYTVTYVAMQLAAHMGFREIALVGCDHNFTTAGPANKLVTAGASDPNHFDPNYFSGGVQWQLPDLVQSEISYRMAGQVFAALGGRIVNCTVGGKLELFPRAPLGDFLDGRIS